MALQRLYSLDDAFVVGLDGLLRDERFVEELHALQEPELSQVVDHLDEVGLPSGTRGPADRFVFADRRPPQPHWQIIQEMPPGFAQDMCQAKYPSFNLRAVKGAVTS